MRPLAAITYFWKRKIQPGFTVRPGERVLDVGSGDKPFWRADVFFDNPALGGIQRITGGGVDTRVGRFVQGSLPWLPFRDGAFDFSFCAHVLEHLEEPELTLRELARVSRRGYIEVPNGILETVEPFRSHLWFIFREDDRLVFVRKSGRMHSVLARNGTRFPGLSGRLREPFIRLHWRGSIEHEVIRDPGALEAFAPDPEGPVPVQRLDPYPVVVRVLRRVFRGRLAGADPGETAPSRGKPTTDGAAPRGGPATSGDGPEGVRSVSA